MPKGVEHLEDDERDNLEAFVKIPPMPKGVEHFTMLPWFTRWEHVKIPPMPKGVEHVEARRMRTGARERENSSDAERR